MKESAKVRNAIEILEGVCCREQGYKIKDNMIKINGGANFKITTLVARRLKELGY